MRLLHFTGVLPEVHEKKFCDLYVRNILLLLTMVVFFTLQSELFDYEEAQKQIYDPLSMICTNFALL